MKPQARSPKAEARVRVALAQIDPTVGDVDGNAALIVNAARAAHARGATLVVCPELALIGYPPRDLLDRSHLIEKNVAVLSALVADLPPVTLVVGYVEPNRSGRGRPVFNAAAVVQGGEGGGITARYRKRLLPTYDVFEEDRYFEPGDAPLVFAHRGRRIGVTICEDLWTEGTEEGIRYRDDPIGSTLAAGAELIVNLSASPFTIPKRESRWTMFRDLAIRHRVPVVFVNQAGGADELIFDGHSMVIDARGRIIHECAEFEPDIAVVDPFGDGAAAAQRVVAEPETVRRALTLGLGDYARKCGFAEAVLGLSGGIDSAVVACLAAEALGPDHVVGLGMPSRFSSPGSREDAAALARAIGMRFEEIGIEGAFAAHLDALRPLFDGTGFGITEENLQARIRGTILMAYSNKFGPLPLATGNKSEMAVGYATLYGDMCGGLAPIGDLLKRRVYDLAAHLNGVRSRIPESTMRKVPSAELRPDQRDEDTLPPYSILDPALELHIERGMDVHDMIAAGVDPVLARRVVSMVRLAEYKRRQAPPVLKVTRKAFGMGRRVPIAQRYRGDE